MKELIKQFNLYGKITEQHAKDIEEILENYDKKVKRETAEKVCDEEIEKDFKTNQDIVKIRNKIKQQILKELL